MSKGTPQFDLLLRVGNSTEQLRCRRGTQDDLVKQRHVIENPQEELPHLPNSDLNDPQNLAEDGDNGGAIGTIERAGGQGLGNLRLLRVEKEGEDVIEEEIVNGEGKGQGVGSLSMARTLGDRQW